jgi:glycosyltransferase involved in cell wall biosynthesis
MGKLCKAFCLDKEDIMSHCVLDGQFNMLSVLVTHIRREQNGRGICAVSNQYANEVALFHSCLRSNSWANPTGAAGRIGALPNAELQANRPLELDGINCIEDLRSLKTKKKIELQKALGLKVDSSAIIGAFVGRLVAQKGVDCIADAASKLLMDHPDLQLIVVGEYYLRYLFVSVVIYCI